MLASLRDLRSSFFVRPGARARATPAALRRRLPVCLLHSVCLLRLALVLLVVTLPAHASLVRLTCCCSVRFPCHSGASGHFSRSVSSLSPRAIKLSFSYHRKDKALILIITQPYLKHSLQRIVFMRDFNRKNPPHAWSARLPSTCPTKGRPPRPRPTALHGP